MCVVLIKCWFMDYAVTSPTCTLDPEDITGCSGHHDMLARLLVDEVAARQVPPAAKNTLW